MVFDTMEKNPGARFLFILACLVIVVAGLRAAADILVPFALALFLAVVSMPLMFFLRRHSIGAPLAIFLTVGAVISIFGGVLTLATNSVGDLTQVAPRYNAAVQARFEDVVDWLTETWPTFEQFDLPGVVDAFDLPGLISAGWQPLFGGVVGTIQTVASAFSMTFLVALIMVFILAEATVFPFKFQAIFGTQRAGRARLTKTIGEVQAYLGIKTLISLATGLTAGIFCWAMDLDFYVLLGIIAFVLNFIPTIGSVLAAIPAMVIALALHQGAWWLFVGLGYAGINVLFGNILEPNLMGRRLGLSTLVIVLSLVFWYWVWGPVGALLSVPLTMVLKIVMENTPDLRWAAVLLDNVPPQARRREQLSSAKIGATLPSDERLGELPGPVEDDAAGADVSPETATTIAEAPPMAPDGGPDVDERVADGPDGRPDADAPVADGPDGGPEPSEPEASRATG